VARVRRSALIGPAVLVALLPACGSSGHSAGNSGQTVPPRLYVTAPGWGASAFACTDQAHLGHSPPVRWSAGPAGTTGYAITVIDPDAHNFVHWVLLDLAPSTRALPEGVSPGGALPAGARSLDNGFGKPGYGGPCPPLGTTHHYVLTVWAVTDHPASAAEIEHDALASGAVTTAYTR
jgi:Raf kinase inhibitor-like YbhB/YbcL family protein